ncbi:MAG: ECF transporter S component [Lachnospiraceae bacterium]|nr:ECF transporter S component [Lachnospiraceae bacterium]
MAQAALFAALSYIMFTYFKIDINLPGGSTAFHLGNTFVVLAALLLGGPLGGMAGALGLTMADLTTIYVTSAPKTFFLKLCIGLITGFVAHKCFHITKITDKKKLTVATIVSAGAGLLFNVVADPLVGYFYKMYLFGIPQDASKALAKIATLTTGVNAALSLLCAVLLYLALRPVLIKADLFTKLEK